MFIHTNQHLITLFYIKKGTYFFREGVNRSGAWGLSVNFFISSRAGHDFLFLRVSENLVENFWRSSLTRETSSFLLSRAKIGPNFKKIKRSDFNLEQKKSARNCHLTDWQIWNNQIWHFDNYLIDEPRIWDLSDYNTIFMELYNVTIYQSIITSKFFKSSDIELFLI